MKNRKIVLIVLIFNTFIIYVYINISSKDLIFIQKNTSFEIKLSKKTDLNKLIDFNFKVFKDILTKFHDYILII